MTAAESKLQKMRLSPKADWRIDELRTVAKHFGFSVREGKGSHVVFSHANIPTALTVPSRRPIKPVYVRRFVNLVDEVVESQ